MKVRMMIDYRVYAVEEDDVPELLALLLKVKRIDTNYSTNTKTVKSLSIELGQLDETEQTVVYT